MIKATFIYQGDNRNMAIEEIRLRLKEVKVFPNKILCWASKKAKGVPDDWFEDYIFTLNAYIETEDDLAKYHLTDSEDNEVEKICEKIRNISDCTNVQRTNLIEYALMTAPYEKTAEYMAEILMDTDTTTWKMFEDLASAYIHAESDQFKEGISRACGILTGCSLETIAKNIVREYKEEE